MALIVFAVTLFVSAFLLFLVQPMIGKMILPKLGGTPQVWNTCMLFFQTVLLAGYFYTHAATNYLKPRKQMMLHGALLFLPLIVMIFMATAKGQPFSIEGWVPPTDSNPIFSTLFLLAVVVGIPFFVVSTSAPLLQKWFSFSGDPTAHDPYFLYGASNFGSMLSLAAYPFFVEPWMAVPAQTWLWFVGYVILAAMILYSAVLVYGRADDPAAANDGPAPETVAPNPLPAEAAPTSTAIQPSHQVGKKKGLKGKGQAPTTPGIAPAPSVARVPSYDPKTAPLTLWRCVRWALLAAVPSSLMLGVTSYVSTDLSPFPLVWAIPLAIYLATFIVVFAKWPLEWIKDVHPAILYAMPLGAVPAFCLALFTRNYAPTGIAIIFSFLAIGIVTLAMHGELAKDRPASRHLTLFFLLMSFGGMLGGLFNALIAPVVFTGVWEYPLAMIVACFLQPNLLERGVTDGFIMDSMPDMRKSMAETSDNFAKSFGMKPEGKPFLFSYFWDIIIGALIAGVAFYTIRNRGTMGQNLIGILAFLGMNERDLIIGFRSGGGVHLLATYGLPLLMCIIVATRSLRYAIGISGLLMFGYILSDREGQIYAGRSFFGVLKVLKDNDQVRNEKGQPLYCEVEPPFPADVSFIPYNYLMHGSTYHGRNYHDNGLTRLATTYYHRFGPVGCVMERYNWFPGNQNTFYGDLRVPASLVALGASPGMLPLEQLVDCWSEPPFATVGLGTGTMASYTRPFGHMAYYEIDEKIRLMSVPPAGREPYFRYVMEAGERGGNVEIIMGDARLSLEREKERTADWEKSGRNGPIPLRENYYKVLVLDAFSSDAIPVHLITEEAIKLYMSKLTKDGVLCVHTSNRHLQLIDPVADIAVKLGLDYIVGKDEGGDREGRSPRKQNRIYSLGHFSSEYIMLANKGASAKDGVLNKDYLKTAIRGVTGAPPALSSVVEWYKHPTPGRAIWTDSYQNIVSIMR